MKGWSARLLYCTRELAISRHAMIRGVSHRSLPRDASEVASDLLFMHTDLTGKLSSSKDE